MSIQLKENNYLQCRSSTTGQAMIVAVLALGGVILGVTTIAGLLMTFQIRQTTNAADSARAIFAADAGIQSALYQKFKNFPPPVIRFVNGATSTARCFRDIFGQDPISCNNDAATSTKSVGTANTSQRAFFTIFAGATSTLP